MNENWSIQLLVGDGDVAGYNQFELVYNQASNTKYKLTQNMGYISGQQPVVLEHRSDDTAAEPSRLIEQNKFGEFEISVYDDDNTPAEWDTILNNVHTLNRHMSGADSTAARYAVTGAAQKVRLAITPDGATNTTYYEIRYGHADVSRAYYRAESQQGTDSAAPIGALFIPLNFTFKPGGEGDTITLRNDLASSPGFIEFNTSATTADGWSLTASAPTPSVNTTNYLTGGSSQQLVTDNTNGQGIVSDTVTCAADDPVVAYAWLKNPGQDDTSVQLLDGSNNQITSVSLSTNDAGGVSDKMVKDSAGGTWYRVPTSDDGAPARAAANIKLRIIRTSANATEITNITIDNAYLYVGSTTVPQAWCSSSALKNRLDPDVSELNINYLDVWGIPGDLPAYLKTSIDYPSSNADSLILAKRIFGTSTPAGVPHFFDSDEFNITATNWTTVVDASRIGGSYLSCAAGAALNRTNAVTFPSSGEPDFMNSTLRCFVVMQITNSAGSLAVRVSNGANSILIENIVPAAVSTWSIVDVGRFDVIGLAGDAGTVPTWSFDVQLRATGSAGNVYVDGIYFFPTFEFFQTPLDDPATNTTTIRNGAIPETFIQGSDSQYKKQITAGSLDTLIPGTENRLLFLSRGDNGVNIEKHSVSTTFDVTMTVTPRTSGLLGTV